MAGPDSLIIAGEGNDVVNAHLTGGTVIPGPGADNVTVATGGTVIILDVDEVQSGEVLFGGGGGTLITPVPIDELQARGATVSGFAEVIVIGPPGDPTGATSGPLKITGRVLDANGDPVIGARVDLRGAEDAVRYTDFSGSYVFRVNAGTYDLFASGSCLVTPIRVTVSNLDTDRAQNFTVSGSGCTTGTPSGVNWDGEMISVNQSESLGNTFVNVSRMSSTAAAQARLDKIAQETSIPATSLTILGHPAVERQMTIQAGKIETQQGFPSGTNLAITTAIAVDSTVVRFDSRLPENAPAEVVAKFISAARNFGGENLVFHHGDRIQAIPTIQNPAVPPSSSPISLAPSIVDEVTGELAVAASDNSTAMVVGTPVGPYFSLDDGATISVSTLNTVPPTGATNFIGVSDPFVGTGAPPPLGPQSFYYSQLAQVTAGGPVTPPSVAIALFRSDDNGATFDPTTDAFPINCASPAVGEPACIVPDQVHIAVDRVNRAQSDGQEFDQIYLGWRNFNQVGTTRVRVAMLACSRDGGASWIFNTTALNPVGSNSDRPRMTVGPDGSLLVAYDSEGTAQYDLMLHRFDSCADGFAARSADGYPVTVDAEASDPPDLSGMPRQPAANYSVAVGADPDIVYVAYVKHPDILVAQSSDGGLTFDPPRTINNSSVGSRYFPSICTTGDTAFVSWFDRRMGGSVSIANDQTGYYSASLLNNGASLGQEFNLSGEGFEDPQCLTGFPRNAGTTTLQSERGCFNLPNVSFGNGVCDQTCPALPCGGSLTPCDLRGGPAGCTFPEVCRLPVGGNGIAAGVPVYGDYVTNDCARGKVFMAWAAASPPEDSCSVSGRACSQAADCCNGNCVQGTCSPDSCLGAGAGCATAGDCCSTVCQSNACVGTCVADGGACVANANCCSGSCQGGQCFPITGIYTKGTSCTQEGSSNDPICDLEVNPSVDDIGVENIEEGQVPGSIDVCATGVGFTPNGEVRMYLAGNVLESRDNSGGVPDRPNRQYDPNDPNSPEELLHVGSANSLGELDIRTDSFGFDKLFAIERDACSESELAEDVAVVFLDVESGIMTESFFKLPGCIMCQLLIREDGTQDDTVNCPGLFFGGCPL